MKASTYTKCELQIIRTKNPMPISCEEYLAIYHKAFYRNDIQTMNHMADVYPAMLEQVLSKEFQESHGDPADEEVFYQFPILLSTSRNTQARVMDMVAYLLGKVEAPEEYADKLHELVPCRLVFNYFSDEYVADFRAEPLWEQFFLGQSELRRILELRSIKSLDELAARACDYFEQLSQYYLI